VISDERRIETINKCMLVYIAECCGALLWIKMRVILMLGTTLVAMSVNGQEKAPVRYIPTDSISFVPTNKKVKLDFKTDKQKIGKYPSYYPSLRGVNRSQDDIHWYGDTVVLAIDGQNIEFIERKGKTVDYYLFWVECLLSRDYKRGYSLVIPYSNILDIRTDSVLFRLTIDLYKKKKRHWKKLDSRTNRLWVSKERLDGVLISELEDE
jgi:hypothetical protein